MILIPYICGMNDKTIRHLLTMIESRGYLESLIN